MNADLVSTGTNVEKNKFYTKDDFNSGFLLLQLFIHFDINNAVIQDFTEILIFWCMFHLILICFCITNGSVNVLSCAHSAIITKTVFY